MKTDNRAFERSLRCLTHPLAIGAVLLLLLNDHSLRWHWPSWWTGKIGDIAWLSFFPLLLATVLAWAIPPRVRAQERIVAGLAFSITGVGFALMNASPVVHAIGTKLIEIVIGRPVALYSDPTDLLTLPVLLAGWTVWRQADRGTQRRTSRGWVVLALGAMATIATTPAPPRGIHCVVQEEDGTLLAISSWDGTYASQDGGMTWRWRRGKRGYLKPEELDDLGCTYPAYAEEERLSWQVSDPNDEKVVYRFVPEVEIERSIDGGKTWSREIKVTVSQSRRAYYENVLGLFYPFYGPLDAVVHQPTGNVVAAMGYEGVLIRTTDGTWHWIDVGPNERVELNGERILSLLRIELLLSLTLFFLTAGTLSFNLGAVKPFKGIIATLAWGGWGIMVLLSPDLLFLTGTGVVILFFFPVALLALIFGITGLIQIRRRISYLPKEFWIATVGSVLLFVLPYALWALAIIPLYVLAAIIAVSTLAAPLVVGGRSLRRTLGTHPELPSPEDEGPSKSQ